MNLEKNKIIYAKTLKEFLEQIESIDYTEVFICNPPNSIVYLGVEFFLWVANEVKMLVKNKKIFVIIDCDNKVGYALNAINNKLNNVDTIIINTNDEIFKKLKNIAKKNNINLVKYI